MKKLLILMVSACISIPMVHAQTQSDTASTKTMQRPTGTTSSKQFQNYPTKDMKRIQSSDIPPSLRTTLQDTQYSGWETGTWYYNNTSGEYSYQGAGDPKSTQSSTSEQKTWYSFDRSGKRITDQPKPKQ